ncbi:hypothetical protein DL93DRAFT_2085590 [Clavulina sp. PMI_390]|nr:hypothetical protein DL93DRAFT_2085590 [Clavulina sp. PMI_390]
MNIRSHILLFVPHGVFAVEIQHLPESLKLAYHEAGFALFWKIRYSSTIPSNPLLTAWKGVFSSTTLLLRGITQDLALVSPNKEPGSLVGLIPRLTEHSYEELIDQCFKAIQYPLALGTDPEKEWSLLGVTINIDPHEDFVRVLASHNFITLSVAYALNDIPKLWDAPQNLSQDSTTAWFFFMIYAWMRYIRVVVLQAVPSEVIQLFTESMDSGLLFVLEVWQSTQVVTDKTQKTSSESPVAWLRPGRPYYRFTHKASNRQYA